MTHTKQLSLVRSALADSLSWCGRLSLAEPSLGQIAAALRSPELRASALRAIPLAAGPGTEPLSFSTLADGFTEFLRARRELIAARGLSRPSPEQVESEMRRPMALVLSPLGQTCEAPGSPAGFFDAAGMPPWDSWVALLAADSPRGHLLLSWVPRWASPIVDAAVPLSVGGSHGWAHVDGASVLARGFGQPWEESPLPICP